MGMILGRTLLALVLLAPARGLAGEPQAVTATDYLTFAQGAVPLSVTIDGKPQDAGFEGALRTIDGNPTAFAMVRAGGPDTVTEMVFGLPAATVFERFSVPNVTEVPSPSTTFSRRVEVFGSATGPAEGFELLASATLTTHPRRGQVTPLELAPQTPAVRWIKLRLVGGIQLKGGRGALQFSELVGNGRQEAPPLAKHFAGVWQGRGVLVELRQEGATVTGCYDSDGGRLSGTVSGSILRAVGVDPGDGVESVFVLGVTSDGHLRGLRSTNGAPFRLMTAPAAPPGTKTKCSAQPPPTLGCGAVIHAINFDFDSAAIRADSETVLRDLHAGLAGDATSLIVIEGHTSSEGSEAHNLDLSQRRAQAVVDALVARGLAKARLRAAGKGPKEPIASNVDEAGRSLNRRVEVKCSAKP